MILVGIVALIFLGPRKLPELAKKAGKIMAEFRGTASEFKETWEREVNFEEEVKSLSLSNLEDETVERQGSSTTTTLIPDAPAIRAADPEEFKNLLTLSDNTGESEEAVQTAESTSTDGKRDWL